MNSRFFMKIGLFLVGGVIITTLYFSIAHPTIFYDSKSVSHDQYGGFPSSWRIKADLPTGEYTLRVVHLNGGDITVMDEKNTTLLNIWIDSDRDILFTSNKDQYYFILFDAIADNPKIDFTILKGNYQLSVFFVVFGSVIATIVGVSFNKYFISRKYPGGFQNTEEFTSAHEMGILTYAEYKKFLDCKKVMNIIEGLSPNIPVNLLRIVELVKLPKKLVEEILISLSVEKPQIGNYLSTEQVYVRSSIEDQLLKQAFAEWEQKEHDKDKKI